MMVMVTACSLSERSFTSGGLMNLFLKEASPLAAFRRKRTCFEKSTSFGFLPKEGRPSASFGKLHLWRGGGFPKEAEGSELVLKKARPSDSSRRKGVLRLPPEGRASFASFGFLWKASPLAGWRFLRKAGTNVSDPHRR